jgi:DNA-binding transcriptional MerR regulator
VLIGALSTAARVPAKTLRFWESEGLLHEPPRTPGGYRDYRPEALDRVAFIRHAKVAGLTLREIGEILAIRDEGRAPCEHVAELVGERLAEVEQRLRELEETRGQLRRLQRRVELLDPADCRPAAICSAVDPSSREPGRE